MKPKIYIAAPLFNPHQINQIKGIEVTLQREGFDFFSPRIHSGSHKLTAKERGEFAAWQPVFDANERALNECPLVLAVLNYPLPEPCVLGVLSSPNLEPFGPGTSFAPLRLPDTGTVWEMGYARSAGNIVVGFEPEKLGKTNLMLSHGCHVLLEGWQALDAFLKPKTGQKLPTELLQRCSRHMGYFGSFDWSQGSKPGAIL